jgi:very-short-patch-repair endonuclease
MQAGVVSRRQALRAGMTPDAIRAKVRSRRWQTLHWGVYAIFSGPPSRRARLWAAVLWAGDGAMLSHHTAAEVHRLIDKPVDAIHITVPKRRQIDSVRGIHVHRSDTGLKMRFPPGALPVTTLEDTVLDLTQVAKDADEVCVWITAAFQRGRTNETAMLRYMGLRAKLRGRNDLMHLIAEAEGGTHSALEFRYDRDVERAHGLPRSRRQVRYTKADGHKGYRDRCYEKYNVIVELDGAAYHTGSVRLKDIDRDNAAAADHASRSLRYGWRHVRWETCETAIQVGKVLRGNGWDGTLVPCGPGCAIATR